MSIIPSLWCPALTGRSAHTGPVTIYPDMNPLPKFTITPDAGYRIDDVTVNGVSQGKITSWTCPDATKDYTIAASFSVIKYKLTVSASSYGTVTIKPGPGRVYAGHGGDPDRIRSERLPFCRVDG